mgnify:CR=1 FL=1
MNVQKLKNVVKQICTFKNSIKKFNNLSFKCLCKCANISSKHMQLKMQCMNVCRITWHKTVALNFTVHIQNKDF